MIASTSKMWMNPPKVYELTIPSNQRTRSITAIVQSIVNPFRARAIFDQPLAFTGYLRVDIENIGWIMYLTDGVPLSA